jgi:DNA modification methylase
MGTAPESVVEPLHRFHPYCARFPSSIAEAAIEEYTRPGDSVYDPFCGSGTSLTAGLVLGRKVIGSDIDVLAGMLSAAKCAPSSRETYARWRQAFDRGVEDALRAVAARWPPARPPTPGEVVELGDIRLPIPAFRELTYWFPPRLIAFLAAIAAEARSCADPHLQQVALLSLSAAIIAKWPNTLSYAMDVDHTRPHRRLQRFSLRRVLATYLRRVDRAVGCLASIHELYSRAAILDRLPSAAVVVYPHDARYRASAIEDESQALVLTSPPYFNAVDYPRAHRLSLCWMDGYAPADVASRRNYIGIRYPAGVDGHAWFQERQDLIRYVPAAVRANGRLGGVAAFFSDLEAALRQVWRVLRPGGHAVIVIADNTVKGSRIESHAALVDIARGIGLVDVARHPRAIDTIRRRFPVGPFGFDGPMTHEHVVVLRRPRTSTLREGSAG